LGLFGLVNREKDKKAKKKNHHRDIDKRRGITVSIPQNPYVLTKYRQLDFPKIVQLIESQL